MNKLNFWLVWGVAIIPVCLAVLMYLLGVMLPKDKTHGGELLRDQHIRQWQLRGEQTEKRWSLLLTTPGECKSRCDEWIGTLENIHTALGKDRPRVLVERIIPDSTLMQPQEFEGLGTAVWIVDPLGNLVLKYSLNEEPKIVLRDLRKLLKVSRLG